MTHSSPSLTARRGEHLRVGARLRLGHRVAREALAVEQRLEVLLLLRLGAVVGDDLGVAGVGCGGAEHDRRPARRAEDLVDQRELELAEALAAELGTEVRTPETLGPHLVLHRPHQRAGLVVERVERAVREDRGRAARPSRARTAGSTPAWSRTRARSRSPTPSRRLLSRRLLAPRTVRARFSAKAVAPSRASSLLNTAPISLGRGQPASPPWSVVARTSFFTVRTASGPFAAIASARASASSTSRPARDDAVHQAELERARARRTSRRVSVISSAIVKGIRGGEQRAAAAGHQPALRPRPDRTSRARPRPRGRTPS